MDAEIQALIELYQLKPLPIEGTLFRQMYRSSLPGQADQPVGTAMIGLYCHEPQSCSLFHRLSVDEVWHFYAGDPLRLVLLNPDGSSHEVVMGNQPLKGQLVQYVVPAGVWQAGHVVDGGRYALFGCTMAPGFREDLFEGGTYTELVAAYPSRAADLQRLSCPPGQTRMPTIE